MARTPVEGPRVVEGVMQGQAGEPRFDLGIVKVKFPPPADVPRVDLMVIDGNRDGRLVLFPHEHHAARLGETQSCQLCHHQNLPYSRNSACSQCHRDMYLNTDTFVHTSHVRELGGNEACARCHEDPAQIKSRDATTGCLECHTEMVVADSRIQVPEEGMTGLAVGYMDAMHILCIECHEEKIETEPATYGPEFARCTNCHRDANGSELQYTAPRVLKDGIAVVEPSGESG